MPQTDIILNGLTLTGLIYNEDVTHTGVRSDVAKTLDGGVVVWESLEPTGRAIDLTGGADFGFMTRTNLQTVRGWAAVPNATYTLTLPAGTSYTVRFRNEEGAISATPLVGRPNPASGDYYHSIVIKLMEV